MNKKIVFGGIALALIVITAIIVPKGDGHKSVQISGSSAKEAKELYQQALKLRQANELERAKAVYQQIIKDYPEIDNMPTVQKELEKINMDMLFSTREIPGKTVVHEVVQGDSLAKIAKKYNTTVEMIQRSNNLSSDVIRLGQKLRIWTGSFNIFVDKSQNILILKDGEDVVKVYSVSTGSNNSTPVGTFKITNKLENPVWFNKGIVVPPESPANVLGTRWLGFDLPGYGIHGTTEPETIGQQVTAGCVRMVNEQVEELYRIVPVGTQVVVVD